MELKVLTLREREVIMTQIIGAMKQIISLLTTQISMSPTKNSLHLYSVAKSLLGENLCGSQHELGCALTVNSIVEKAFGLPVGGGASTSNLYDFLLVQ